MLERYYEAHREALAKAYAGAGNVRERLHRMIDAYLDFMAEHVRYAALIQQQLWSPETHPLIEKTRAALPLDRARAPRGRAPRGARCRAPLLPDLLGHRHQLLHVRATAGALGGSDPTSRAALDERRRHVHWLVNTVLDALEHPARQ